MLETSVGVALIAAGSLCIAFAGLSVLNPFGLFGRKVIEADVYQSPALSTVVEAPAPMLLGGPGGPSPADEETLNELFAELLSLRSMVGGLSRDMRTLKSQLDSDRGESDLDRLRQRRSA